MKFKAILLVCALAFSVLASAAVSVKEVGGWFESGYVTWNLVDGADSYNVYCKAVDGEYKQLDAQLIRNYGTYGRADVLGIAAGTYQFKIVPVSEDGSEMAEQATETATFEAKAHDRGGFAHFNYQGVGAYNDNGTLKSGAKVIYVTSKNAKTVSCEVNGTTFVGIQDILTAYEKKGTKSPLSIRLIGKIDVADLDKLGSSSEGLQVKGNSSYSEMNITIEGVGNDATVYGFGFLVRNCTSVEFRNIAIMKCIDDGLSFDTDNSHCWVHNVDFFYGNNKGGDQAKGDGSLDVKGDSQYMTFSYNHFWDSGKSSLCGMKSESGENFITYHHNWFDHSDSRHPRVRTMTVHVYNNYYDGVAKYGVGATTGANVFVESNYFRNTNKPMMISLQGTDINNDEKKGTFSGESGGMIKSYGNAFEERSANFKYVTYQQNAVEFDAFEVTSRDDKVPSDVKSKVGSSSYNNFDTDASKMYSYTSDAAADIPGILTGQYGAGRMQHGDFTWTFTNATDDASYAVDEKLTNAVVGYQTSLVGFFTEVGDSGEGGGDNPGGDDKPDDGTGLPSDGDYTCYFKAGKEWSNKFYDVAFKSNASNSKGTVTVNGVTYSYCLKMESTTAVRFTTTEPATLTLVFQEGSTPDIMIDDRKVTGTSGNIITCELSAGSHELAKAGSHNLFYINLTSKSTTSISADQAEKVLIMTRYYNLSGVQVKELNARTVYIQEDVYEDGSVERTKVIGK